MKSKSNSKVKRVGVAVDALVRSSSIDDLPADIRHSIKNYGLNYGPLKDRLERMGVKP